MSHYKQEYEQTLHAKGHRVTPQRVAILDAICDIGRHAAIGDIQLRLSQTSPTTDLATIYRNLKVLCDVGLLVSAHTDDLGIVYEIAETTPHHHLLCVVCGRSQSIEGTMFDALRSAIQQSTGFTIQADHLVLKGICKTCEAARNSGD